MIFTCFLKFFKYSKERYILFLEKYLKGLHLRLILLIIGAQITTLRCQPFNQNCMTSFFSVQ